MSSPQVSYRAILKAKDSEEITSLIAYSVRAQEPLKAVGWHAAREMWMYAPGLAAGPLFDDLYPNESIDVDRPTAERLARTYLHTELPSLETILEMYEEGQEKGWTYGPPEI